MAAAVLLALVVAIFCGARMSPRLAGAYHDDGIYLATAKALAEGKGYRLIDLPGSPPQTKYPFLYPLLLAGLWKIHPAFPDNLYVLDFFSLACAALAVAGAYLFLRRWSYGPPFRCFVACAIAGTSGSFIYFGTQALSEALFALLVVVALWSVEDDAVSPDGRRQVVTGVSLALPFLTRTIGLVTLITGLHALWRRRRLKAAAVSLAVAATWLLWIVAVYPTASPTATAESYYSIHNYLDWWSAGSWRAPLTNAVLILFGTAQLQAESLFTGIPWPVPVAIGVVTWVRIVQACRPRARYLPLMLLGYGAVMLMWTWPPKRFLTPLLPFLAFYTVDALGQAINLLHGQSRRLIAVGSVAVVLSANTYHLWHTRSLITHTGYPAATYRTPHIAAFEAYSDVFSWLRANTNPNDVIASGLDSMIYLYTGRQAIKPFVTRPASLFYGEPGLPLGSVDDVTRVLQSAHVRYVVDLPMPDLSETEPLTQLWGLVRVERPGCLQEVYRPATDNRFVVLEVDADRCAHP